MGRICFLLGCPPSDAEALPAADFDFLCRYFEYEPWGPWRDNLHAAMIAREVRRIRNPKFRDLATFMYEHPEIRRRGHLVGFVELLKAMSGGKRVHISEHKPPKRRKRGRSR